MNPILTNTDDPFESYVKRGAAYPSKAPAKRAPEKVATQDPFEDYVKTGEVKKKEDIPSSASSAPSGFQLSLDSESIEPSQKTKTPSGFLVNDIELSERSGGDQFGYDFLTDATLPLSPEGQLEEKQKRKISITTEPDQLKKYSRERITALQNEIADLESKAPTSALDMGQISMGIPSMGNTIDQGQNPYAEEISAKKKYLQDFKNNVANVAAYAVVSKEDLTDVSDAKLKSIGEKYLRTISDSQVADDVEVLRTMDATGASKIDADRTSENINFKLYKTGADAMARYYNDVAEDAFVKAQPKAEKLNSLFNQQAAAKTPEEKNAYQLEINELMQDQDLRDVLNAERSAQEYVTKSANAMEQFPQVKRRAVRQQLSDAYFNMMTKKPPTGTGWSSIPEKLANWLVGDKATEEDVPALAKAVGISEDEARDIIKSDIKGFFGSADEAGVRIPGMLIGIGQASDETIGKAVMGAKRFFNTENVEAENRLLTDRMNDYNLKAQKAKLFDDAGKLNFNPTSVFNTMGTGIGQTAIYAAPSLLTGGAASVISGSEKLGKLMSVATTTGTGFVGSYEDGYKEAARYTDDEAKRRAYATKIGLVNGLSESILEPADIVKKMPGFGAKNNKDAFEAFSKMYDQKGSGAAMAQGLKEFGKVVGTENIEELAALIGETRFKESELGVVTPPGEFINQAIETAITTTLTTLPLGIGAGINANRDQSGIIKEGLFEAGNEPELYKSRLKGLLDNGTLNQDQYNNRVSVVNTMAKIVPSIKPTDINGNPLSYSQKSDLAAQQFRILNNNKLLENPDIIEAEKPLIEADTKEATEIQTNILNGQSTEQMAEETPPTPTGELQNDIRNDLSAKIQNLETKNATVNFMKNSPDEAISFIQEQATGMTATREDADESTYNETVNMFGEDIVNQAVSILPQDQKDMIIKSWDAKGIVPPEGLLNAIRSSNINPNESQGGKSEGKVSVLRGKNRSRDDFPETQSNTRTPVTKKILDYFSESTGSAYFTDDLSKGTYISWLQSRGELGYKLSELLNSPKRAFDLIYEYEKNQSSNTRPVEPTESSTDTPAATTAPEIKRIVEPSKPISEMNSEELYEYSQQVKKGLKAQDKEFEDKTEQEKEDGGYYDVIDDVEDLRDASERLNFIENAQNIEDLSDSATSVLGRIRRTPNEYQLSLLNGIKNKAQELNISPNELIQQIAKKTAAKYEDAEDALTMVEDVMNKVMGVQDQEYENLIQEISNTDESRQEFEEFVQSDEQSQQEIISGENEIAADQQTEENNEEVPGEPAERKPAERKKRTRAAKGKVDTSEDSTTDATEDTTDKKPKKAAKVTTIEQAEEELRNMFAADRLEGGTSGSLPVEEYTKRATAILSQLYPDATVRVYENADEYYEKEGRPVGSLGVFHPADSRLALNLDLIRSTGASNTVLHEVIHPIVNEALLSDNATFQQRIDDAWARLQELKDVQGMKAVFDHVDSYAGRGTNIQKVEGITEFLTQVADGNIDLSNAPKSLATKVIDLINDLLRALGSSKRISSVADLDALAASIKQAFETSDATPIVAQLGTRQQSQATESTDAIAPEEQEKAIRDLISRSKSVDQNQLKDLIKKYTGWSDEKIGEFFLEEKPKTPSDDKKDKSILNRLVNSEKLSDELKDAIREKGLKYKPRTHAEARKVATTLVDDVGVEDAVDWAETGKFHGDVNSMIYAVSLDKVFAEEQAATNPEEKLELANQYADIALRYQDAAESGGRFVSAIQDFYKKSPAGLVIKTEKEFARKRDMYFEGREGDMKQAFEDFINTAEGKEIFDEKVSEIKPAKEKKKVFSKDSETKVRNFFDKLKINTKTNTGSYLVPPQFYNAAIDVIKEAVVAGISIGTAIERGVDYINDNYKGTWKINDFKKDIRAGFKKQGVQRQITEEDREKILKKWDKKLRGLDAEARNKLLNRAFIELMDNGALSLDQFKQMYAEAVGLPVMTQELADKLTNLANSINKPDTLKDDLEKNPTPQKIDEYKTSLKDAEDASRELNELIGKERWWVDTFATVMRLNTLGIVSLVGNIVYNVAALPVRFSVNLTSTGLDYLVSGVQITSDKLFGTSYIKSAPRISPFRIQKAWFRGFVYGASKAIDQVITGVSNRDYFQKEVQQNLRPFAAGKNLWKMMTGQKKASLNQIANAFIESFPTGGMSANFIARMLNLGDKPFRFASEFAKAEELAINQGLTGINKEVFMLFPDEQSEEIIRKHGEEVTFQQKNIVTKAVDAIGNTLSSTLSDKGPEAKALLGAGKIFGYTMQPFLNTPMNVFNEFIHYAFPPLSIYKASKAAIKGDAKSANNYAAKAIIGWSIQAAATQLVINGLLVAGGDDDETAKERKGIQTYQRQGQMNLTGLKRLMAGDDPTPQDEDLYVDIKYWGFMGMMLLAKGNQYKKNTKEEIQQQNFAMDMMGMFPAAVTTGLTEGVFSGTSSLLSAISMGGGYVDNWLLGMANTAQNSFNPQWLRQFSIASNPYMRDTKGVNLPETGFNQIKQRFFSAEDLPIRRNIWGDKIESAPKDVNAYMYYFFGINKKQHLDTSQFGYALYDLYQETKDHNLFPPILKRDLKGHDLNPKQYEQLQELVGSHRKQMVDGFIKSGQMNAMRKSGGVSAVSKYLGKLYNTGREIGVREFLSLYPELQTKK